MAILIIVYGIPGAVNVECQPAATHPPTRRTCPVREALIVNSLEGRMEMRNIDPHGGSEATQALPFSATKTPGVAPYSVSESSAASTSVLCCCARSASSFSLRFSAFACRHLTPFFMM
jgi:hypothetical protein